VSLQAGAVLLQGMPGGRLAFSQEGVSCSAGQEGEQGQEAARGAVGSVVYIPRLSVWWLCLGFGVGARTLWQSVAFRVLKISSFVVFGQCVCCARGRLPERDRGRASVRFRA